MNPAVISLEEREESPGEREKSAQHTRPVAHQHASRASSITTFNSLALASSAKKLAADVPVMPEPTMTMSASVGRTSVVRWPRRNSEGSLCQKEAVESDVGKLAMCPGDGVSVRNDDYSQDF